MMGQGTDWGWTVNGVDRTEISILDILHNVVDDQEGLEYSYRGRARPKWSRMTVREQPERSCPGNRLPRQAHLAYNSSGSKGARYATLGREAMAFPVVDKCKYAILNNIPAA